MINITKRQILLEDRLLELIKMDPKTEDIQSEIDEIRDRIKKLKKDGHYA